MNVLLISATTERANLRTLSYGFALVTGAVRAAGQSMTMLGHEGAHHRAGSRGGVDPGKIRCVLAAREPRTQPKAFRP